MTRVVLVLFVLAALVATGFVLGHWVAPPENPCEAFDADRWHATLAQPMDVEEQYHVLRPLAEQLEDCPALLRRRSRAGVRELLGRPAERWDRNRSWSYNVGAPLNNSDAAYVTITFGADGRWAGTKLSWPS